jgi:uncharacterized protein YacL
MSLSPESLQPALAAERRTSIVLRIVRAAFIVLMFTFALLFGLQQQQSENRIFLGENRAWMPLIVGIGISVLLILGAIALDLATPKKKIQTITGVIFGVLAGVLAAAALGFIIDLLLESWVQSAEGLVVVKPVVNGVKVLIGITLCYVGVTTVLQTQDDFRLVIPYVEFAKQIRGVRPLLLDTSALIDGRIADIAATGFLQAPAIIPRFVIEELQTLADSTDPLKRARGRRGLEMVSRLQRTPRIEVSVDEAVVPGVGVDQMLVELARLLPAVIVTTDSALAQVARINNIAQLNLNDLANALKSSLVPGESITVKLLRQGEQPGQAVGYLPDGALVVCENGGAYVNQERQMIVQSSLQTSAGRLIFARITTPTDNPTPMPPERQESSGDDPQSVSVEPPASQEFQESKEPQGLTPSSSAPPPAAGPTQPRISRPLRPGTPRNPRR